MTLLTVDTSGAQGSLAVARLSASKVLDLHQVEWLKKAMHSELATVKLQELLKQADLEPHQLTHLAVNVGPGSFTGLRVGISLAKTLAYALSLPIASLNSLELLASQPTGEGAVFVATKAIQNFYYAGSFHKSATGLLPLLPPQSVAGDSLIQLAMGHTKVLVEGQSAGFSAQSQAKDLVRLIAQSSPARPFFPWKSVEPLYIRASEAEEKLKQGLLKPL